MKDSQKYRENSVILGHDPNYTRNLPVKPTKRKRKWRAVPSRPIRICFSGGSMGQLINSDLLGRNQDQFSILPDRQSKPGLLRTNPGRARGPCEGPMQGGAILHDFVDVLHLFSTHGFDSPQLTSIQFTKRDSECFYHRKYRGQSDRDLS